MIANFVLPFNPASAVAIVKKVNIEAFIVISE